MKVKYKRESYGKVIATNDMGWGTGDTIEEAKSNLKRNVGNIKGIEFFVFVSELEFAEEYEIDWAGNYVGEPDTAFCYVNSSGAMKWGNCMRVKL